MLSKAKTMWLAQDRLLTVLVAVAVKTSNHATSVMIAMVATTAITVLVLVSVLTATFVKVVCIVWIVVFVRGVQIAKTVMDVNLPSIWIPVFSVTSWKVLQRHV